MILSLIDNWNATGSVDQIVQWSGSANVSAAVAHAVVFFDTDWACPLKMFAPITLALGHALMLQDSRKQPATADT